MPDEKDPKFLANLFQKIRLGFSETEVGGKPCSVRHANTPDIEKLNYYYQSFFEKSKNMGVMEEKELLELLDKEEVWTKKDADELFKKENELKNLKKTISNLLLEAEKKPIQKRIDEIDEEISGVIDKRDSLLKNTAEKYADRKSNEMFVRHCLFKDKELKEEFYTSEEFDEIDSQDLSDLYTTYNKTLKDFSEKNLKQISISSFFFSIFNLFSDDLTGFFKIHPMELSFYQINLLNYAKMFNKIFENHEIPENIRNDADAILKHIEDVKNKKKRAEEVSQKAQSSDGFSFAKAKAKDLENMGIDKRGTKDIHSMAEDKGGDLSMEDFMKMHKK
jgi:hypothetical protein